MTKNDPVPPVDDGEPDDGGEVVCFLHLVCPDCGAVVSEGHRPGCPAEPAGD